MLTDRIFGYLADEGGALVGAAQLADISAVAVACTLAIHGHKTTP